MKQETLLNHTNLKPYLNSTHWEAWAIGSAVSMWSWYNVVYWFRPPKIVSVALVPLDPTLAHEEFSKEMFAEGGFLYDRPLTTTAASNLAKTHF